jgi:phosphoglycolate phosphatase-like HAD superfamily hydrolase
LTQLLVLFDVDGTLFLTHDPLLGRALRETLSAHFGVELPEHALERIDHEGQTSLRIGRLVLEHAGLDQPDLGIWCAQFGSRFEIGDTAVDVSSAREAGIQSLRVGPGTDLADALSQLG